MFVTPSDFVLLPYAVANAERLSDAITALIDRVEKKYLKQILGVTFYNTFITELSVIPAYSTTVTYTTGQKVSSGNNSYVSLQDANTNKPIDDTDWWGLDEENNK